MFRIPSETSSRLRSAGNFINFLTRLEYPGASTLQPEQILWAYENEESFYLLDWLCENVDVEKNYIGNNESGLNKFELEKIKKEYEDLEREVEALQKRKNHVIAHRDQLKLTSEELENQLSDLKKINHELDDKNKDIDKLIEDDSVKLDANTVAMTNTISNVISERVMKEKDGKLSKNFLSQCTSEICEIIKTDQDFTRELQKLCDKLFPRIEDDLFDPNEIDEEIKRLKYLYPRSECKYIQIVSSHEYWVTYLKVLEGEVSRLDSIAINTNDLALKYEQYENGIVWANQEIDSIMIPKVEDYLHALAELEIEKPILMTGYSIQSDYQESIIERMNMVIDLLTMQYARLQLTYQAFNIELDNHKDVHKLLTDVTNELKRRTENVNNRMKLLSASDFVDSRIGKTVVEISDDMVFSMKKLMNCDILSMSPSNNFTRGRRSSTFVTYESLKEKMTSVQQSRENARSRMEEELKSQQEFIKSSEEIEDTLTSILYKDSFTSELIFTPRKLSDLQSVLGSRTKCLQPKITQVEQ
ncbi:10288_t:CDS:10, partial [Acaulospora morrowiae]